jgi:hypothetical protein
MSNRTGVFALAVALALAGVFAWLSGAERSERLHEAPAEGAPEAPPPEEQLPGMPGSPSLPPGHPPLPSPGAGSAAAAGPAPDSPDRRDDGAVHWQVPKSWETLPNPSPMRIATYRVRGSDADAEGDAAEMSVSRAGGSVDANVRRWVGQFQDAPPESRSERTIKGIKVTIVEVSGTYLGSGMMPGAAGMGGGAEAPRPRWSLLAAIAEPPAAGAATPASYFFKLVGPTATVRAARAAFDKLVETLTPRT